jgi:hypothetical protein
MMMMMMMMMMMIIISSVVSCWRADDDPEILEVSWGMILSDGYVGNSTAEKSGWDAIV